MEYDTAITIDITGDLADHVVSTVGQHGYYETATEYVRDLIRRDIEQERHAFDEHKTELQRAFATPLEDYVTVSAEQVIARNRFRRGM